MITLEVGKTYLTRHGRFTTLDCQPWDGIFNGDYEADGRDGDRCGRWKSDGRYWNFFFMGAEFYEPQHDIIMEDSTEAREVAYQMKLERKQKAYDTTT